MKNSILILLALTVLLAVLILCSCEKEPEKNCACNRIESQAITYTGVNTSYAGYIHTVNDCSLYRDTIFVSGQGHNSPPVGSCY